MDILRIEVAWTSRPLGPLLTGVCVMNEKRMFRMEFLGPFRDEGFALALQQLVSNPQRGLAKALLNLPRAKFAPHVRT